MVLLKLAESPDLLKTRNNLYTANFDIFNDTLWGVYSITLTWHLAHFITWDVYIGTVSLVLMLKAWNPFVRVGGREFYFRIDSAKRRMANLFNNNMNNMYFVLNRTDKLLQFS